MTAKLNFPNFEDILVSTKTFTSSTNLDIIINQLFEELPITPYVVFMKKRGRKKKGEEFNPNQNIAFGSIITVKYEGKIRGIEIKPKKNKTGKKNKWFRNSISVVIILDKPINFKICRNGTFQMTGCKTNEHAEQCIKFIWEFIHDKPHLYSFKNNTNKLETFIIPSMRNIDFSLGFFVDREKLNKFMTTQNKFHCLLETSFGYTGVNIKIPLENDISEMEITQLICNNDKNWEKNIIKYEYYLNLLPEKEKETKLKDAKYNTFLVFHSGKVIHSGLTDKFMKDVYYYFLEIMAECYNYIEERLD
jgi:TATA-box binding protein (TBP) (component of TFIID and TFIIIB)